MHEKPENFDFPAHCSSQALAFVHNQCKFEPWTIESWYFLQDFVGKQVPFSSMSCCLIFFLFRILMATLCCVSTCSAIFTCNGHIPSVKSGLDSTQATSLLHDKLCPGYILLYWLPSPSQMTHFQASFPACS